MFKWLSSFFTIAHVSWVRKPRQFVLPTKGEGCQEHCNGDYLKSSIRSRRESRIFEEIKNKKQRRTQSIMLFCVTLPFLLLLYFI